MKEYIMFYVYFPLYKNYTWYIYFPLVEYMRFVNRKILMRSTAAPSNEWLVGCSMIILFVTNYQKIFFTSDINPETFNSDLKKVNSFSCVSHGK